MSDLQAGFAITLKANNELNNSVHENNPKQVYNLLSLYINAANSRSVTDGNMYLSCIKCPSTNTPAIRNAEDNSKLPLLLFLPNQYNTTE